MLSEYTWYQKSRLQAIEVLAYWQGRINTRDLMEIFGISRQIAQKDMNKYIGLAPGNLVYQQSERVYGVTSVFKPMITQGDISEYLVLKKDFFQFDRTEVIAHVPQPQFSIDPSVFRGLLYGINHERQLLFTYHSLNNPQGLIRNVYPLRLVYSGFRWHLRAFCQLRNDYRDFNLMRIADEPDLGESFDRDTLLASDQLWNETVVLKFVANSKLPAQEQALIEHEFGFNNGMLEVETRKALVNYTLQAFQVSISSSADNVRANRIELGNSKELSHLFWVK